MRIFTMLMFLIMLCSCSSGFEKPSVITDGFSCMVTADYVDYEHEFILKREASHIYIEYTSPPELAGVAVDISPSGRLVSLDGHSVEINQALLDMSLSGALLKAFEFDYSAAEYDDGAYTCRTEDSYFVLTVFLDGRISTVNFPEIECKCYFNY